tara:strand:- start:17 stop:1171 length:1155 start_codon:yes stop_codon:yes gene_type:complete
MKICVVTGSRAEYGLLFWLIKAIDDDPDLQLQLIVTGMHLSPKFGYTYKEIEKDFNISSKIEILSSDDTSVGISKSMGLAQISLSKEYERLKPDIIIVLGDRYEIFSAASVAMIANIPIAHIAGGESTEGAYDESMRHSITKMSSLHFTATDVYKKRVIQLGENPKNVFNVGALAVESAQKLNLLSKKELEKEIGFSFNKKNLLVTFHPTTLEPKTAKKQFQKLLDALDQLKDTNIIFTKANSDTDGQIINEMIDNFVSTRSKNNIAFFSLGHLKYFSVLQFVDAVVGNSSSGITEAPLFKVGTINIGNRQKGRIMPVSVINCKNNKTDILNAIDNLYSKDFQSQLKKIENIFGNGKTSNKILKIIKNTVLNNIVKKKFYDIKF